MPYCTTIRSMNGANVESLEILMVLLPEFKLTVSCTELGVVLKPPVELTLMCVYCGEPAPFVVMLKYRAASLV